jgi:hypothetical protein
MIRALLLSPLIAALAFAIPEAWQHIQAPGPGYVPILNEILLFVFGYLATAISNATLIVPLCLLARLKTPGLLVGIFLAFFTALFVTTVAYAFEIFDYQTSIFHPAYLYTLFVPLFLLTLVSFYFLGRPTARLVVENAEQKQPLEERA